MIKISNLIGKNVVSIYEGKILGTISGVVFDQIFSKINFLELFDGEDEEFVIDSKSIFAIDDVITTKNGECLTKKETVMVEGNNPINYLVYTTSGKFFGNIKDVCVTDKLKTDKFEFENNQILTPKDFLKIGQNVAILQTEKRTKLSNFKSQAKFFVNKDAPNNVVTIESENQNKITVPKKVLTDNYNFLIGRKLNKNIYADNKQLLAKKQTTITSQIIDIASKNGKLKELTNSSIS